eukprot:scaffold5947_cov67-Skeletonema_dohrnii-CCMP3373.AAC.2
MSPRVPSTAALLPHRSKKAKHPIAANEKSTEVTSTLLHTLVHILFGNLTISNARLHQFFIAVSNDALHTKWVKIVAYCALQLAT